MTTGELCSHVENMHNQTAGWEFSFGLHIGFNGLVYFGKWPWQNVPWSLSHFFLKWKNCSWRQKHHITTTKLCFDFSRCTSVLFLACILIVIGTVVLKTYSSYGDLTEEESKEKLFLGQTALLCCVDFICWTPSILLGTLKSVFRLSLFFSIYLLSLFSYPLPSIVAGVHVFHSHLHDLPLLSTAVLRWITFFTTSLHTVVNPIIVLITSPHESVFIWTCCTVLFAKPSRNLHSFPMSQ